MDGCTTRRRPDAPKGRRWSAKWDSDGRPDDETGGRRMMDILRTRLEVVLAKHGVFFQATAPLLDDLVACLPQPSREELLRLLMPIYEANNVSASVIEKILDVAMTWATTPEEKKIWCSH